MNKDFSFKNGQKYWLQLRQGTVTDNSVTSATEVSTGPRGTQVIGGHVISTPGAIQSEVITTVKVWVTADDGSEEQFDLSEAPVPLRTGHRLGTVYGAKEGEKMGSLVASYNYNTKQIMFDPNYSHIRINEWRAGKPPKFGRKFLAKTVAGCAVAGALAGGTGGALLAGFAGIFIGVGGLWVHATVKEKEWIQELKQRDENAHQMLLDASRTPSAPLAA